MKKLLFSFLCAAAFLTACNSDELIVAGGDTSAGELGEPQFLSVNLITASTRAPQDAEYEAGLAPENKVDKVRFYFFDAKGDPAVVSKRNTKFYNWLDWEDVNTEGDKMENVEKILSATLVIQSPKGDGTPAQIVAIVNPTEDRPSEERSLITLSRLSYDYGTFASGETPQFVMSNSTYMSGGVEMNAVSVDGKIHKTAGEALDDPVQIYVERVVAKVRLGSALEPIAGMTNVFKTSKIDSKTEEEIIQKMPVYDKDGNIVYNEDGSMEYKEIYVKFLGWNTTAVANISRLVKDINVGWPTDLFGQGNGPWNWADYFRSFWAVNPENVEYQYGAFKENAADIFAANSKKKFDKSQWVYINENATDNGDNSVKGDDPATKTKVIIAAQLVDSDGEPIEVAEYGNTRTTINGLKVLFANNCGLYRKVETGEGEDKVVTFDKITPADLTIKTATAINAANQSTPGRYKSYVQLAKDEDNVWYASTSKDAEPITAAEANAQLKGLGYAKVWTEGYTYYYFDIKHLGNKYGVVRNHIYDATINTLTGLGTPVYDPDEIIYPEKPVDDNDSFIAAQINILSWRVVKNDVSLDWN